MPRFDRLNTLANFLDDLPSDRFHMPAWASADATPDSCGTAGCACGWAATIFKDEGWTICGRTPVLADSYASDNAIQMAAMASQSFGAQTHPSVLSFAKFFGISIEDACWITTVLDTDNSLGKSYTNEYTLDDSKDITPRHAADRIRKVIRKLGGEVVEDYPVPEHKELVR